MNRCKSSGLRSLQPIEQLALNAAFQLFLSEAWYPVFDRYELPVAQVGLAINELELQARVCFLYEKIIGSPVITGKLVIDKQPGDFVKLFNNGFLVFFAGMREPGFKTLAYVSIGISKTFDNEPRPCGGFDDAVVIWEKVSQPWHGAITSMFFPEMILMPVDIESRNLGGQPCAETATHTFLLQHAARTTNLDALVWFARVEEA
jgi:hypothetical protein